MKLIKDFNHKLNELKLNNLTIKNKIILNNEKNNIFNVKNKIKIFRIKIYFIINEYY